MKQAHNYMAIRKRRRKSWRKICNKKFYGNFTFLQFFVSEETYYWFIKNNFLMGKQALRGLFLKFHQVDDIKLFRL